MRVLLLADIHANWPALQAIRERYDVCICLGDLVDYALEPSPCLEWLRREARYSIRGNHDHDTVQNVRVPEGGGFRYLTAVTRPVTRQRLSPEDFRYLAELPVSQMVTLQRHRFLLVHATPRDPLDEWAPNDPAFWEECLDGVDADVICVGHTHQPYILTVRDKLVINPGSVGLPRDGDPRASYAVIENSRVQLHRVEYPVDETIRVIEEGPLPDDAKAMLAQVLRTGGRLTSEPKPQGSSKPGNGP
ncbi:MAG: metallophosphatase family protein [Gemmataceae bacterium]|nr:metallophosphatase family protein [Gemmataceae bacterium]MDW8267498.1 metallophosphoesterase family protein [Gemmataceae bacterium]